MKAASQQKERLEANTRLASPHHDESTALPLLLSTLSLHASSNIRNGFLSLVAGRGSKIMQWLGSECPLTV